MALKNVTLNAEETLIHLAREKALREKKSLNAFFREWLSAFVERTATTENYRSLMKTLSHVKAGQTFSRDLLNER